jgi:hypothetical protein
MRNLGLSIFRERAVEKYIRRQEQHVILRLASPPTFVFLWILLLLSLAAATLVGFIQVPIVVSGEGIVIEQTGNSEQAEKKIIILLLLPPGQQAMLQAEEPVHIRIKSSNSSFDTVFNSSIEYVIADPMSPARIRTQFSLPLPSSAIVSGPAIVATARVEPESLAHMYLGSQGHAEIQVGSESALFLIPGIGDLLRRVWVTSR